jgi:hypothetical protein
MESTTSSSLFGHFKQHDTRGLVVELVLESGIQVICELLVESEPKLNALRYHRKAYGYDI